jgi:ABC-type sugar transport system substrate-binding protein
MRPKNLLKGFLVGLIFLCFSGVVFAGGQKDGSATGEEPKEIVYVTCLLNVYYGWNIAHQGFLDQCEKYGYIGTVVGPNQIDTAMQLDLMDTAIGQGVDAIIAVPLVPDSYHGIYEKANEAGIIIGEAAVTAGSDLPNVVTSGFSDNTLWGEQAAEEIAKKTGGKANVLAACTAVDTPNQLEAREAFQAVAAEKYPGLNLVQVVETNSDFNSGLEVIKNALTAYPEIDFIWANEGFVAQSAATAVEETGKKGEITILAVDCSKPTMDLIISGDVWATFDQAFYTAWGTSIVDQFKNYWEGKPVEKVMHVPFIYYDQDNITEHPSYEENTSQ